jgi:hypothetical protein
MFTLAYTVIICRPVIIGSAAVSGELPCYAYSVGNITIPVGDIIFNHLK